MNLDESGSGASLSELLNISEDALDTDNESVDPTFDGKASDDDNVSADMFCEDFVLLLDSDQRRSLGIFLSFQLEKHSILGSTKAAELAGMMTGRSDKSIRAWKSMFFENGEVPLTACRENIKAVVFSCNENLNKKLFKYIRMNNNVKEAQFYYT